VELVSYEDAKGKKVFVLINHGGRENSFRTLFVTDHISDPQPAYRVELKIRTDKDVTVVCGKEKLAVKRKGKYAVVPIVMDSAWKFITVK
jgi:hypothetical protein